MGIVPKCAVVDNSLCKVPWLETRVKGNRPKYYNRRALSRFSRPLRGDPPVGWARLLRSGLMGGRLESQSPQQPVESRYERLFHIFRKWSRHSIVDHTILRLVSTTQ